MPEQLTESFCERCGTRYTFESQEPQTARAGNMRRARVLVRGLKNYVLQDELPLEAAMADARREEERERASQQLEAFHQSFNFCMSCRQYTCLNCWNEAEGKCLGCAPAPEAPAPDRPVLEAAAPIEMPADAWPGADRPTPPPPSPVEALGPALTARDGAEEPADLIGASSAGVPISDGATITLHDAVEALAAATAGPPEPMATPVEDAGQAIEEAGQTVEEAASQVDAVAPAVEPVEAAAPPVEAAAPPVEAAPHAEAVEPPARTIVAPNPTPLPPFRPIAPPRGPSGPVPPWPPLGSGPEGGPSWPTGPSPFLAPPSLGVPAPQPPRSPAAGVAMPSVWEASSVDVISRPGSGVQACVSCGLALSANARFCRRCGTRQA